MLFEYSLCLVFRLLIISSILYISVSVNTITWLNDFDVAFSIRDILLLHGLRLPYLTNNCDSLKLLISTYLIIVKPSRNIPTNIKASTIILEILHERREIIADNIFDALKSKPSISISIFIHEHRDKNHYYSKKLQ